MRNKRLTAEELRFISENMKLSGFSGRITKKIAGQVPDMRKIAESAKRFGAQIPGKSKRPRIAKPRFESLRS